jgi:hypothetical protein
MLSLSSDFMEQSSPEEADGRSVGQYIPPLCIVHVC